MPVRDAVPQKLWDDAQSVKADGLELDAEPEPGIIFGTFPADLLRSDNYKDWEKDLKTALYQTAELTLYQCSELKAYSQPGETEGTSASVCVSRHRKNATCESKSCDPSMLPNCDIAEPDSIG
ncbi:MAG: hypothetical protein R3C11_29680 [Planctomycetaceae bacterium]